MSDRIRIANCSGFLGDRHSAAREMVEDGPIDVLTGDYLAELTMAILARQRLADPSVGYARPFLRQMEEVLVPCREREIRVVANAGGLNPTGLATAVEKLAETLGIAVTVATVRGDDLMPRLEELAEAGVELRHVDTGVSPEERGLELLTANAYLGGWGIAAALQRGADIVITGRVSDASLVVGPAAWRFGWANDDWDALAGAVVAGHVIECGAQATGGNFSFFAEIPHLAHPGFPIAEVGTDGTAIITKHAGTGGAVTVETVTAQLLYEVGEPAYLNPDVVARLDTVRLEQIGDDRVLIADCRGEPAPDTLKVGLVGLNGYRNEVTFILTGLDIEAKAELAEQALWEGLGDKADFGRVTVDLLRTEHTDPRSNEAAFAYLKVAVVDNNPALVGRSFSNAAVELALANYPGLTMTAPPRAESPYVVFWPTTAPAELVPQLVTVGEQTEEITVSPTAAGSVFPQGILTSEGTYSGPEAATVAGPLGRVIGTRSGDKGGHANLGVWARSDAAYTWLRWFLTSDRLGTLLPETKDLEIERYELPNLRALNFIIRGFLGEGVASSTKLDPQAKTLGEYLRAQVVQIPEDLLAV